MNTKSCKCASLHLLSWDSTQQHHTTFLVYNMAYIICHASRTQKTCNSWQWAHAAQFLTWKYCIPSACSLISFPAVLNNHSGLLMSEVLLSSDAKCSRIFWPNGLANAVINHNWSPYHSKQYSLATILLTKFSNCTSKCCHGEQDGIPW